jgi:DsbC/DsbD-like thiol-disulfide interchange protein
MQIPFHRRDLAVRVTLFTLFSAVPLGFPGLYANDFQREKASELKLIAAEKLNRDIYHAGIEIDLKPGALTYWRQPGDAGVPPIFSFEGSTNLASAKVLYPAPTRIKEDEGEAFGYRDKVVFPLHVTPRDKTKPVILKLTVDYAVCERICIPVRSQSEVTFPSVEGAPQETAIAAAEALLPKQLSKTETAEKITLVPEKNAVHPAWRLGWKGETPATDLFAEAPEGWFFETKKTAKANEFTIVAVETPKGATQAVPLTLTLTGQSQNFEFTLLLDPNGTR